LHKTHGRHVRSVLLARPERRDIFVVNKNTIGRRRRRKMTLSKLLGRVEAASREAAAALIAPRGATQRIGDVVMSVGVANDLVVPANDFRPHILAKRAERRERRDIRSA
jgi:hypothetical protein